MVSQGNYEVTNGHLERKQKHHDDDRDEGCPVSAVVSQGNYEVTNSHLEKKQKDLDDDGGEGCPVSAVVSQGSYEVTSGHLEKKNRNIMMMMGVTAVLSLQWCLRGTMKTPLATWKNGHLEKKTETS